MLRGSFLQTNLVFRFHCFWQRKPRHVFTVRNQGNLEILCFLYFHRDRYGNIQHHISLCVDLISYQLEFIRTSNTIYQIGLCYCAFEYMCVLCALMCVTNTTVCVSNVDTITIRVTMWLKCIILTTIEHFLKFIVINRNVISMKKN